MTDKEYVKRLGALYDKIMKLRSDKDYVVNQPQMDRFVELVEFFAEETKKDYGDGRIESVNLVPKEENGGLTASFVLFDIFSDRVQDFSKVIGYASAVSIDSMADDRICISITVPDVFKKK